MTPAFDRATPVADIVAYVDAVRRRPVRRNELVELLAEQAPLYAGRGTNEAERLRGYMLASFQAIGLPPAAMHYVLEELQTGLNPYTVAAAAKALRGAANPPDAVVRLLLLAIDRIKSGDDAVCFDSYAPSARPAPATALAELFRTLAWLGSRAAAARQTLAAMLDNEAEGFSASVRRELAEALEAVSLPAAPAGSCCAGPEPALPAGHVAGVHAFAACADGIEGLELQDQNGALLTFGEFFRGRPSIMTFFYTRCMNPEKCSLTITKLARLQKRISDDRLQGRFNVAALSYDPAYDLPQRLRAYGADRGMTFDARNRLLRTTGPFEPMRRYFDLGVGYGAVTVNRHRLDLFILDAAGRPCADFTRLLWSEDEVLSALIAAARTTSGAQMSAG
ncbi:MAG: hypothetical protein QOI12_5101 [Alphaproteobacteria bacterium]|jgi:protein SCO1/2|nr:hypothetical protein [Alphaproteobacteria bacterium]